MNDKKTKTKDKQIAQKPTRLEILQRDFRENSVTANRQDFLTDNQQHLTQLIKRLLKE